MKLKKRWHELSSENDARMPLTLKNYVLLIVGFAVIVAGFALMSGGGSHTAEEFDYSIFSWRRISLAPVMVVAGFVFEIYAILKRFPAKSGDKRS
ncbi:MAG: DUF3098 domain-containing protein [Alistipes sp.]|nr:DUF3098 domain-containing protein [Alistipes sp.]MDE7129825.1 DUF3098 domain-containing protein [Alistipes sp.]